MVNIFKIILDSRGYDHLEISDEDEYINFIISGIVYEPEEEIKYGYVLQSGECIGYTRAHSGNPHYFLASILSPNSSNPLLDLDINGAIKIKHPTSIKCPETPIPTNKQREIWEEILYKSGWVSFNLGWSSDDFENSWYSLGKIRQMDIYSLNEHLTK